MIIWLVEKCVVSLRKMRVRILVIWCPRTFTSSKVVLAISSGV